VRQTIVIHSRLAWRHARTGAAEGQQHGLQALTIETLASRLAGGFLQPIDSESLKESISKAIESDLGELNRIKNLPGFSRAAARSLSKAWSAGLNLPELLATASREAAPRLAAILQLETALLRHLPPSMLRPADLVAIALTRIVHARTLFGTVEIRGSTEMAPVWRRLAGALAGATDVRWAAGPRHVPDWVRDLGIAVLAAPAETPDIARECCASPRHEALEALRWARELIASGRARPGDIAIAAASPEEWDDHFLALSSMAGLDVHFVHGRKVLTTADGQLCAALAEVLLRGPSQSRMVRLVSLLRSHRQAFSVVPAGWQRQLPPDAPLLDLARWRQFLAQLTGGYAAPLQALLDSLALGLRDAARIGDEVLEGLSLAIWQKALTEGPAEALDVTLATLRLSDDVPPEAAIVWTPASALASAPRPVVRLVGLTSSAWPRRPGEDPLLPDHVVPAASLDPLPVHEADRRDFETILRTAARQVVCSRARRDAGGRMSGVSPLYAAMSGPEHYRQRARIPEHAAGWSDRLFARPAEFETLPAARSAHGCWTDWHTERQLTAHDGLVRPNHPLVLAALQRQQSATSLSRLLRDPLGYLWRYGFRWEEPGETEEPLQLDANAFGEILHGILEGAVSRLEDSHPGGFASAGHDALGTAIDTSLADVAAEWEDIKPIPPPVIWRRKLRDIRELAFAALAYAEEPLPGQRSWAEVPFGGHGDAAGARLPWPPLTEVVIPGTQLSIRGSIDRLDMAGDGKTARVTDYKSGKPPKKGIQLKGGSELQRCLYAFAVKALIPGIGRVSGRLLYPKADSDGLYDLADPEEVLDRMAGFAGAAVRLATAGNLLPGIGAQDSHNDLAFALPGGAKESYFELKGPLVNERLSDLVPLWEMA
jgi:hypothetical protein